MSTTSPAPSTSTPEPVLRAAGLWGSIAALLTTAIGVLVALGLLSDAEATALSSAIEVVSSSVVPVGLAVVGVVGIVSGVVASLATAFSARRKVVPTTSDAYTISAR